MSFYKNTKSFIQISLSSILYYSGLLSLYNKKSTKNIKILAYHDISEKQYLYLQVPKEIFEKQILYLKKHYEIISLKHAIALFKSDKPIDKNYIIITFDDGYKSVYTTAYPILKKYNVPFTVFLTTESIDTGIPPFVDCLAYAVQNTKEEYLDLKSIGLKIYNLSDPASREVAIAEINSYSKSLSSENRKKLLINIYSQLNVSLKSEELKEIMLSWKDVIELSSDDLVEFGAHTHTHPSLSKIPLNDAKNDILYSKKKIESIINKEVSCFAYPYGTKDDINEEVISFVSSCGFKTAFTLSTDNSSFNLFNIPRLCVVSPFRQNHYKFLDIPHFAITISGFYNLIRKNKRTFSLNSLNIKDSKLKNKLKIFYFIDNLYLTAGTERHLTYLIKNLKKNQFYPIVCTFKASEEASISFKKNGIPFINLNLDRIYNLTAIKSIYHLKKTIKKISPDIVQTFHFKSDTYGVLAARLAGVKHIVSSRRDTGDLKKPRQILLNKIANRFIDRFIMVCDKVGESFHRLEGIPYDKMVTLYNGVDIVRFNSLNGSNPLNLRKELGFNEDDFIVGTTAIFRPEKAYHIFFEGIEKVIPHIKNLKVLVCGDGPTRNHFENYCSSRDLGKIVVMLMIQNGIFL